VGPWGTMTSSFTSFIGNYAAMVSWHAPCLRLPASVPAPRHSPRKRVNLRLSLAPWFASGRLHVEHLRVSVLAMMGVPAAWRCDIHIGVYIRC
jgi:hypothetical protein